MHNYGNFDANRNTPALQKLIDAIEKDGPNCVPGGITYMPSVYTDLIKAIESAFANKNFNEIRKLISQMFPNINKMSPISHALLSLKEDISASIPSTTDRVTDVRGKVFNNSGPL